jgi:multidrug efflux pump subunit AcrA (membrane-fusion protein)
MVRFAGREHEAQAGGGRHAFARLRLGLVSGCCRWLPPALLAATAAFCGLAAGCDRRSPAAATGSEQPPALAARTVVRLVKPQRQTIRHPIEQPGFNIEAFQETPLYAKITGYIASWKVDIGDRVHKDQSLAEIHVPEMVVDLKQKDAAVRQATAQIAQARAAVKNAQAQLERSKSQYERLARLGGQGTLDREQVEEARLGAQAAQASLEKAHADVAAAEAQLEVAKANRDYSETMLQYTQIKAPYDGVVTQRNVNAGDFVQPAGTGIRGQPLFVVSQIDPVRVFVNIPGADAPWIKDGDPVSLRLQGAGGELFQGKITRNARSLNPQARTLRTEIDVPNPNRKLLPGMYVQATITVQHPDLWTLPAAAVATEGDQTFCYRVEDSKAVRTPLQVGLHGGGRVEVLKKQTKAPAPGEEGRWEDVTGTEEIVAGDVAALSDGQPVQPASSGK